VRTVDFSAKVGLAPDETFVLLSDFGSYPSYTETVRNSEVERLADDRTRTSWEVNFRNGILKWVEEEHLQPDDGRIEFQAIGGDLERFDGFWQVTPTDEGCTVQLHVEFDSGLGTLSDIVEPIAERTLRENFEVILRALVGGEVELVA
jgi:ribosome-associated toxin RatA of RatAB toxin-antitoxin module